MESNTAMKLAPPKFSDEHVGLNELAWWLDDSLPTIYAKIDRGELQPPEKVGKRRGWARVPMAARVREMLREEIKDLQGEIERLHERIRRI